jgi:glycosyltransferase involved in cell wall biosynthesis
MKLLTFVISTRNRSNTLEKIINEIGKLNVEIIIIDDNSNNINKKKNFLISKKFRKIKYFYLKKNCGQSFALNYGINYCQTKYIWFFDDDDFINKKSVDNVLKFLKQKKIHGLLISMAVVYKDKIIEKISPKVNDHNFARLITQHQKVSTSCSIFKTEAIKKIGGWDENLVSGTDTDLFLRFSKKFKFNVFHKAFVKINYSAENRVTNDLRKQLVGKIQFLYKHYKELSLGRIFYYIFTFLTLYPLFNNIKQYIKLIRLKKNV